MSNELDDNLKEQLDEFFTYQETGEVNDDGEEEENDEAEQEETNDEVETEKGESDGSSEEKGGEKEEGSPSDGGEEGGQEGEEEVVSLKKQNELLMQRLEELSSGKQQEAQEAKPNGLEEVFKDLDVKQLMENPENFTAFLAKFATAIRETSVEQALRATPSVMGSYLTRREAITKLKDDFYADNVKLIPVKNYVAGVANDVSAEHPDWTVKNVLDEAAKRTYTALGIVKEVKQNAEKSGRQRPAFAKQGGGSRNKSPELTGVQKQINDLINLD